MGKIKVLLYSLFFTLSFYVVTSASAFVNTGWDWHLVNGEPKRTIHYCVGVATKVVESGRGVDVQSFTTGLPEEWQGWMDQAVENLNDSNTGWKLEPVAATFPPCQVILTLADISESIHGGGVTTPVDTNGDGKADIARVTIDISLEDTVSDLPEGQDGENPDGWNSEGSGTMDPVAVLMHELMHTLRLDHHPDSKHSDSSDSDISDPRKVGDHSTTLSEEDLNELREASGTQEEIGQVQIEELPYEWSYGGVNVFVAKETFDLALYDWGVWFDINIYDGVAIPDPLAVPSDYSHVIGSGTIYWRTSMPPLKPVKISISYSDEELMGGDNLYFGDLHNFVPPALDEESLVIMHYVQRPFGVESEIVNHWEKVEGSVVDTDAKTVTFESMETGIYAISGMERVVVSEGEGGGNGTRNVLLVILLLAWLYRRKNN